MENRKNGTIVSSLIWKVLEKFLVQGINLIVQIVLARILLPEDFGNLAVIVAITNYVGIFVQSGVSTVIIQRKDITDTDISTLFISSMFFAIILYLGLFFMAPLISSLYNTKELIWPIRILSLILFLNSINAIQTGIYSKRMAFKKIFIRSIIAVPISGAIGTLMAVKGFGLWSLIAHNLINMGIIVGAMSFDKTIWFKLDFSMVSFKKLYSFTGKIIITSIITGGSDLIRTLLIGRKYSFEDLAYYDKAYTYSNYTTQIIGQSVTSVMLPSLSKVQENRQQIKALARQSIGLSAFIMFPILLGVAAVAEQFVYLVLTEKWMPSVLYLMIFCVLRMPSFISSIDKQVYYALGKSEIVLFYEIAFLLLNLTTLTICMQFGVLWIAIGATVVEWVGCFCLFWVSNIVYKYSLFERISDVWKAVVNSILMFLVCFFIGKLISSYLISLIVQIFVGVTIYLILSVLTKDKNTMSMIKIMKRRQKIRN